jgi:hypothetical protein
MLAEPWGYARENIAPLVLVEVWTARPLTFHFSATRQRRPTLVVVSSCARTRGRVLADQQVGPTISANNHE